MDGNTTPKVHGYDFCWLIMYYSSLPDNLLEIVKLGIRLGNDTMSSISSLRWSQQVRLRVLAITALTHSPNMVTVLVCLAVWVCKIVPLALRCVTYKGLR